MVVKVPVDVGHAARVQADSLGVDALCEIPDHVFLCRKACAGSARVKRGNLELGLEVAELGRSGLVVGRVESEVDSDDGAVGTRLLGFVGRNTHSSWLGCFDDQRAKFAFEDALSDILL